MTYRNDFFAPLDGSFIPVTIRNYTAIDIDAMIRLQAACFPPPFPEDLWWNREQLESHVSVFPDGSLCAEHEGRIIGSITGLLVDSAEIGEAHKWEEVTDQGYIRRTHKPQGDTLYIVDICIDPAYRKAGIGKELMHAMYHLVVQKRLVKLIGGGRMPGYHQHAGEMQADEYVRQVLAGKLKDPVITFLLRCGRSPVGLLKDYLEDEESHNYAVLMEWRNPFLQ